MITLVCYLSVNYLIARKYAPGFLPDLKNLSVPEAKTVISTDKSEIARNESERTESFQKVMFVLGGKKEETAFIVTGF